MISNLMLLCGQMRMKGLSELMKNKLLQTIVCHAYKILLKFIDFPSYNSYSYLFKIHLRVDRADTPNNTFILTSVNITSSASVTSEDDHQVLSSSDRPSSCSHCPCWQTTSPPVLLDYLFTQGGHSLRMDKRA